MATADRILTWFIESVDRDGTEQGPVYYLERDYTPLALRILARRTPDAGPITVDILDDGVSILADASRLEKGDTAEPDADAFPLNPGTIAAGSVVTLDITSSGGAHGITVQLELEAE